MCIFAPGNKIDDRMGKEHEKLMNDFHRLLDSQNFKTEDDLRKFMDSLMGQKIPTFPDDVLTDKEKAEDLVIEAYDLPAGKAMENINKALALDADCIQAYEYLASISPKREAAMAWYEKGIRIGERLFGGEYLKENHGHFWLITETRPFMRCMQGYADMLFISGNIKGCAEILEEMISLNPNDNQGVRDLLLLCLIDLGENAGFRKYAKLYNEDSASFALFNKALFAFKTEGSSENANKKLKKALQQNRFVAKKLISKQPVTQLSEMYGIGDENEADYYVIFAKPIWYKTFGAMAWLKKQTGIF